MKAGCLIFLLALPVLILILPIVGFIKLFSKTDQLSQELHGLYAKVVELESQIKILKNPELESEPETLPEILPEPEPVPQPQQDFQEVIEQIQEPPATEDIQQESDLEEIIPINFDKFESGFTGFDFETFFAGRVLNRIGAIAIILGVGFFLKYAFDNNWINEYMQVLIGFMVGGGFLYGGHRYNEGRFKPFAQGLAGTGIAVLYITIYCAYNFYHLIPSLFAIVLMSAVTILAFLQALKYDSIAVAVLGLIGGFLTPFLLASGSANATGLLAYLAFLNILIVVLMHKKDTWKILELLGITATYIIFAVASPGVATGSVFLTLYWGLYLGLDITRLTRGINTFPLFRHVLSGLNAGLYLLGLCSTLSLQSKILAAAGVIIAGGVYLSTLFIRKSCPQPENLYKQFIITSIIALVLAINTLADGFAQVIALSLAGAGVFWIGINYKAEYVWKTALGVLSLAFTTLLATNGAISYEPMGGFTPILNIRAFTFMTLIGAIAACSYMLSKTDNKESDIHSILRFTWTSVLFILLTVEINDYFQTSHFNKGLTFVMIWMTYALSLLRFGIKKYLQPFLVIGFTVLGITIMELMIVGLNFPPIISFIPVINLRFIAFGFVIGGIIIICRWLAERNNEKGWENTMREILNYTWCILLFSLVSVEVNDYFAGDREFTKQMTLLLGWCMYSLPLIRFGLKKNIRPMLWCGAGSLLIALYSGLVWGAVFYPIDGFTPVLNMRFLALSVIAIGLFLATKWLRDYMGENSTVKAILGVIQVVLCVLMFFTVTFEVKDYYNRELMSNMKQLVMSITWLLYAIAIMSWGILQRIKAVRYTSIVVLSISILKIFLFDLAFLDQPYRIISFIALGLILFFASYLYHQFAGLLTDNEGASNKN